MATRSSKDLPEPFTRWRLVALAAVSEQPQLISVHWRRRGAGGAVARLRSASYPPRGRD